MSISQTVSDLTGKSQSTGVETQPGVEHLRRKARRPLVPPTTSIWRPEITFLQMVRDFSTSTRARDSCDETNTAVHSGRNQSMTSRQRWPGRTTGDRSPR